MTYTVTKSQSKEHLWDGVKQEIHICINWVISSCQNGSPSFQPLAESVLWKIKAVLKVKVQSGISKAYLTKWPVNTTYASIQTEIKTKLWVNMLLQKKCCQSPIFIKAWHPLINIFELPVGFVSSYSGYSFVVVSEWCWSFNWTLSFCVFFFSFVCVLCHSEVYKTIRMIDLKTRSQKKKAADQRLAAAFLQFDDCSVWGVIRGLFGRNTSGYFRCNF